MVNTKNIPTYRTIKMSQNPKWKNKKEKNRLQKIDADNIYVLCSPVTVNLYTA